MKEEEEQAAPSLFGGLTNFIKSYTGNKTMTKEDIEPLMEEMTENLASKNVSKEIAEEICKSVE